MTLILYVNCQRIRRPRLELKCYQCAVIRGKQFSKIMRKVFQIIFFFKGYSTRCPRDSRLYELTGWNACMTWRLGNGTVILQNFVRYEDDCTPSRRRYWRRYMAYVWGMDGDIECCTEVSETKIFGDLNARNQGIFFLSG